MKTNLTPATSLKMVLLMSLLMLLSGGASAGGESLAVPAGSASFIAGQRAYVGSYIAADKSVSVDIDGLTYKGNYAATSEDDAGTNSGAINGQWGRAFLFASSAKTLRCQLDAGFPKVVGQCQDAGSRQFQLQSGAAQPAATAR